MKEVVIQSFFNYDDAASWVETQLWDVDEKYDDIRVEIVFVNHQWRASVTYGYAQSELFGE